MTCGLSENEVALLKSELRRAEKRKDAKAVKFYSGILRKFGC